MATIPAMEAEARGGLEAVSFGHPLTRPIGLGMIKTG